MARQEGGWPLGLQPLNLRGGVRRNVDMSFGSTSFSTFISGSPTSFSDSSSDLDTESTGSFFQDRSVTLGRLIGITSVLDIPSANLGRRHHDMVAKGKKTHDKRWTWLCLCMRERASGDSACRNAPSLGDFLELERRSGDACRRNQRDVTYELVGWPGTNQPSVEEENSLFSDGRIAPPRSDGLGPASILDGVEIKHHVCCW